MKYRHFKIREVEDALLEKGYFIHNNTSNNGREEADRLCEELAEQFNQFNDAVDDYADKIVLINSEVPPSCNYGVIRRSDQFPYISLKEDKVIALLENEIENSRYRLP